MPTLNSGAIRVMTATQILATETGQMCAATAIARTVDQQNGAILLISTATAIVVHATQIMTVEFVAYTFNHAILRLPLHRNQATWSQGPEHQQSMEALYRAPYLRTLAHPSTNFKILPILCF
eukprot:SAG31_NODE_8524_length_1436_cov_1.335079_2_plen_121_part_01